MDEKNEKILKYLRKDGRASYTEIAEEIGVSEGTVRNRVEKMKQDGVIEKFSVETGTAGPKAVVMVKLETGKDIDQVLKKFPGQIQIKEVTGGYDLILEVERPSNQEINDVLDEIRSIDGVDSTETYMVLNERKES
ncbi:MAG: Lrp/AsnC family transcriptional regulator [Candidatus Nanohalobium sp.]